MTRHVPLAVTGTLAGRLAADIGAPLPVTVADLDAITIDDAVLAAARDALVAAERVAACADLPITLRPKRDLEPSSSGPVVAELAAHGLAPNRVVGDLSSDLVAAAGTLLALRDSDVYDHCARRPVTVEHGDSDGDASVAVDMRGYLPDLTNERFAAHLADRLDGCPADVDSTGVAVVTICPEGHVGRVRAAIDELQADLVRRQAATQASGDRDGTTGR